MHELVVRQFSKEACAISFLFLLHILFNNGVIVLSVRLIKTNRKIWLSISNSDKNEGALSRYRGAYRMLPRYRDIGDNIVNSKDHKEICGQYTFSSFLQIFFSNN
jgi:hypothetical protein